MAGRQKKSAGASQESIADLLAKSKVCIVAGPGGVGKTTVSATLAMEMAKTGLRVAVVTIDPAKRLASALGLEKLDNTPHRVTNAKLAKGGVEVADGGELWAMALDPKAEFDGLIAKLAPDAQTRDQVLDNRIYKEISGAVAGAQEFMAVSKLYELEAEGNFDLIVLDTPPSRNALDFLDAPARLSRFFDGRAIQLIMKPATTGLRLAGGGTSLIFSALKRFTGVNLLGDLSDFFAAISGLVDGLMERIRHVGDLLVAEDTVFLIVTTGEKAPLDEARYLADRLKEDGRPLSGLIVNQVSPDHGVTRKSVRSKDAKADLGEDLSKRLAAVVESAASAADRDKAGLDRIVVALEPQRLAVVERLAGEVHDVEGLARIGSELFQPAV
jgi:anion-transporting  ArsA/GET3 family ATPase